MEQPSRFIFNYVPKIIQITRQEKIFIETPNQVKPPTITSTPKPSTNTIINECILNYLIATLTTPIKTPINTSHSIQTRTASLSFTLTPGQTINFNMIDYQSSMGINIRNKATSVLETPFTVRIYQSKPI